MATTVNNTTANTRITIIFDAAGPLDGNGPAKGTGNTESDVYVDSNCYPNIRSHTEIDSNIHALQWNATNNTGEIEFIDNRENEIISSFPQWAANVIIRTEAENIWKTTYRNSLDSQMQDLISNPEVDKEAISLEQLEPEAIDLANTERNNYLAAHNITY